MILINNTDTFSVADFFFVVGILAICVIFVTISMYKEAFKNEKNEPRTASDRIMDFGQLQEKYEEISDRNLNLLEEISRLKFENSYLANQVHSSDLINNSEFQEHIKDLIILSHPDKHGDHERAKRITQWLLQLRQKN